MSTRPQERARPQSERQPVTLPQLREMKEAGEPIVMVTAYDHPSAQVVEEAGVDMVLVGDSAAMTVLGYDSTVPVGMDEMLMLAAAVRRGLAHAASSSATCRSARTSARTTRPSRTPCGSSRRRAATRSSSSAAALRSTARSAIVSAGIPVMGHVGLTPQTATAARRLQGPGQDRGARCADRRRGAGASGGWLLRDRLRGRSRRIHRSDHGPHGDPGHRHRSRPRHRRPGAGVPRPARHLRRPRREVREALRERARRDDPGRQRLRGRGALWRLPRARSTSMRSTRRSSPSSARIWAKHASEDSGTFSHSDWDWGP